MSFFFNHTPTAYIYTLSLHDALPISHVARGRVELSLSLQLRQPPGIEVEFNEAFGAALNHALEQARARGLVAGALRSEEHTSELQSLTNLVCRLLLEKKKTKEKTTNE